MELRFNESMVAAYTEDRLWIGQAQEDGEWPPACLKRTLVLSCAQSMGYDQRISSRIGIGASAMRSVRRTRPAISCQALSKTGCTAAK